MDVSEEYVKMCRNASEIQTEHQYTFGDWFLSGYGNINSIGHHTIDYTSLAIVSPVHSVNLELCDKNVWLPRQDQLQYILIKANPDYRINEMIRDCYEFGEDFATAMGNSPTYPTFEQLWLAFVMHMLYKKEWNGSDWELIE